MTPPRTMHGGAKDRHWLALLAVALACPGCTPHRTEDFIAESPFLQAHHAQPPTRDRLIVTCRGYVFELPASVDLGRWRFWQEHRPSPAGHEATPGFPPDQTQTWAANGLKVATAPLSDWQRLREGIIAAGGITLPQVITLIRNPQEMAEVFGYELTREQPVFILGRDGQLRGYTAPIGETLFRVSCVPLPESGNRRLRVGIVPIIRTHQVQQTFQRDPSGTLRRLTQNRQIIFDQMLLNGILQQGSFVCIAPDRRRRPGQLGRVFLTGTVEAKDRQLVLVLVPQVQTITQVKNTGGSP